MCDWAISEERIAVLSHTETPTESSKHNMRVGLCVSVFLKHTRTAELCQGSLNIRQEEVTNFRGWRKEERGGGEGRWGVGGGRDQGSVKRWSGVSVAQWFKDPGLEVESLLV